MLTPRDPNRIPAILEMLKQVWTRYPDWRLGQLIENLDISFFTEDDEALRKLHEYEFDTGL